MQLPPQILSAVRAQAQKAQNQRSFYLYDTSVMRGKIAKLKATLPENVAIYYAMKANPHPAFIAAAGEAGVAGVEIASLGEAQRAIKAGFSPSALIFTGPGKSPEELRWSVTNNIETVHIESLTEANRLNAICAELGQSQDILVRVNPNFHIHGAQANFSGDSSKLGIDESRLGELLPQILNLPHLNFLGLHVYSASGVLELKDLLKNVELVFDLATEIEDTYQGVKCSIIDFGGGFGIDYTQQGKDFSPETYAKSLEGMITKYGFAGRRFVLELGRYLTADSGWYCTEILDIKDSMGKKQVVCAGGAHHFRRPVALGINHPLTIIPMHRPAIFEGQEKVDNEDVFIGGPLCNTADKLAPRDIHIDHAEIGDMAVFSLAGAYGYSMSHLDFLSHAHPAEVVLG
jgi:diaminopimelate decarboxylase